jgi:hypothetical protein
MASNTVIFQSLLSFETVSIGGLPRAIKDPRTEGERQNAFSAAGWSGNARALGRIRSFGRRRPIRPPSLVTYRPLRTTTSSFWLSTSNDDETLTGRAEFLDVCCVDPFERLSRSRPLAGDSTSAA